MLNWTAVVVIFGIKDSFWSNCFSAYWQFCVSLYILIYKFVKLIFIVPCKQGHLLLLRIVLVCISCFQFQFLINYFGIFSYYNRLFVSNFDRWLYAAVADSRKEVMSKINKLFFGFHFDLGSHIDVFYLKMVFFCWKLIGNLDLFNNSSIIWSLVIINRFVYEVYMRLYLDVSGI